MLVPRRFKTSSWVRPYHCAIPASYRLHIEKNEDALTRLAFTASSSECICISLLSLCRKKQAYDLPPNIISKATLYPKGREASSTYSSLV